MPFDTRPRIQDAADLDDVTSKQVEELLRRITFALGEVGLDGLIGALQDADGGLAGSGINVIPSSGPGRCCPVVLAVAQSGRRGYKLASVMRDLRHHLADCEPISRVVILVTDTWTGFEGEHLPDWRAAARRGVVFKPFLVAGGAMSPIPVAFGTSGRSGA
jgi:hypothetical protein